jgi:hypothetical protein
MTEQLLPTRQDHVSDDRDVVLDLDAINPKPIVISFKGKRYELKPLSLGDFLGVYQAFDRFRKEATLDGEQSAKEMTDKMVSAYSNLFKSVCPELTKEVVKTMSSAQASLLLTQIVKIVNGSSDFGVKKNDV